jgi:hypothetical protein
MRIWSHRDARIYEGTPREIVTQMMRLEFVPAGTTLEQYVRAQAQDTMHYRAIALEIHGESEEALAAAFIEALIAENLATSL